MILTIDIGNTNHSFALHDGKSFFCDEKMIREHFSEIKQVIYSSVASAERTNEVLHRFKSLKMVSIHSLKKDNQLNGMKINYSDTLGDDRLALAYYCFKNFTEPTLAIDFGTYTTIDLIEERELKGGYILPGDKVYFESYEKGNSLKNIQVSSSFINNRLPQNSEEAIGWSYLGLIIGFIENLAKKYEIAHIVLTGGDFKKYQVSLAREFKYKFSSEPLAIHLALNHLK